MAIQSAPVHCQRDPGNVLPLYLKQIAGVKTR